jgi:hypothetical protein
MVSGAFRQMYVLCGLNACAAETVGRSLKSSATAKIAGQDKVCPVFGMDLLLNLAPTVERSVVDHDRPR